MAVQVPTRRRQRTRTPGITKVFGPSRTFPRADYVYELRYRGVYGETRRRIFETIADAEDEQRKIHTDKRRGEYIDPRRAATPFADVAEKWYAATASRKVKTRKGYRQMIDRYIIDEGELLPFQPSLGSRPIGKITPSDLRAFIASLDEVRTTPKKKPLSPTTKRNIFRTLSPIFNLAIDDGMIAKNPAHATSVSKAVPHADEKEQVFLTAEEVHALAREIGPPYDLLVEFTAYTGLRAGEVAALKVRDLDLMNRRVRVRGSVSEVDGKLHNGTTKNRKDKRRDPGVPLVGFLVDPLMAHVAGKDPEDFVFTAAQGGQLRHGNFYRRRFKPAVRHAIPHKAECRFHDLRHTCASLLIDNNVHPKAISEWLGHSSIAITMDRYGHLYPDHTDAIVAGLEATRLKAQAAEPSDAAVVALA
jgi:integrase